MKNRLVHLHSRSVVLVPQEVCGVSDVQKNDAFLQNFTTRTVLNPLS